MPGINLAHAVRAPTEPWYPAGPESNTLQMSILGAGSEFNSLGTQIDFMDTPLTAAQVTSCNLSPNLFLTTVSTPGQFCYDGYWQRAISSPSQGIPNFFTWLNAYSSGVCISLGCALPPLPQSPPLTTPSAGSIRLGLATTPSSLNPYIAGPSIPQNFYVLDNIYDKLYRLNPMDPTNSQLLDWMTVSSRFVTVPSPPPGTVGAIRNTLRNDLFFHNGQQVTAFDIAYTYVSLINAGVAQLPPELTCPGVLCILTGITVLNRVQFDFDLSVVPSIPQTTAIGSLTVIPGSIWSSQAANWNACLAAPLPVSYTHLTLPTICSV